MEAVPLRCQINRSMNSLKSYSSFPLPLGGEFNLAVIIDCEREIGDLQILNINRFNLIGQLKPKNS